MWILGGAKTKTREVEGGRVGERYCEGCEATATFRECDVMDTIQAFFIDLFDYTQRRMVCRTCGEDLDVEEFFETAPALPRPAPSPPKAAPSGSLRNRLRGQEKGSAGQDDDIEKELAALKRKLARKGSS